MAQIAVFLNYQSPDDEPAHLISRSLALSFLEDGHAVKEGEAIRLKPGRSLKSLKADYRAKPKFPKSTWIPDELPPCEVEGLIFMDPARKVDLFAVRGRSVLVRMAREICEA